MGFIKLSYECSDLIEEIKGDISEFGEELEVCVLVKDFHGCKIYKEYDFMCQYTN